MSYSTILIIMIGVIGILFLLFRGLYMYIEYGENYIVCFFVLILLVAFFTIRAANISISTETKKEKVKTDAVNGYELYLDGKEVKLKNIDLDNYKIKIDDSEKKIILSR